TALWRSNSEAGALTTRRPRYRTAIRSATSNTSGRLCETTSTATPRLESLLIRLRTISVWATPRAAVGSSMMTSLACDITAFATATDWRWPPDSEATGWRMERTVVTWSSFRVSRAAVSMVGSSRLWGGG